MDGDEHATLKMGRIKLEDGGLNGASVKVEEPAASQSYSFLKGEPSPPRNGDDASLSRSGSADTPTSSKIPKLSKKESRKLPIREPPMFGHLPDATADACKMFRVIPDCLYGSKHMGSTDGDVFDCDCRDEWHNGENLACGEDSDCINRATKMECSATGGNCSNGCQNQRFQQKQYADVSVVQTEKKGFGLRTNIDLQANDFIFEYIGEVIGEPAFRRRMLQYDQEGIKHFYFMSLNKAEFVDATKKGNLGRFCNHSCNPNCYVDKWVVGDKLRMGIFALRPIRAGEELVFNYNVDRYGADPQPCYCGEPNCVGFIGGKTQTERATKLPIAIVEALGIDSGDGWDTTTAKKPRKKRADEDDEEYVNSLQPRSLEEEDAPKVMAALMQCKEKWIAVKLLERIQHCDNEKVIYYVMRIHAYPILKSTMNTFIADSNVILQILGILERFPRMTRNKIEDSKIESTVQTLVNSEHEEIAARSKALLEDWSKLEMGFRIKRRKIDPSAPKPDSREERRGGATREEEPKETATKTSSSAIDAPKGPRNSAPQRNSTFFINRQRRPFNAPLPEGWFTARDSGGNTYFYNKQGATTWKRPTQPAVDPVQKGPSKAMQEQALIQSIINRVTKEAAPKTATPVPSQPSEPRSPVPDSKKERWRSLSTEKQMKIYENTVFPPVKHVLDKFRHKLPKDELKRLGKDIAKKLVASDYKNNRVDDPTAKLTEKQVMKIKKYVKDFLDRAVEKYNEQHKKRAAREGHKANGVAPSTSNGTSTDATPSKMDDTGDNEDVTLSDAEDGTTPGDTDRKRKHEALVDSVDATPSEGPDLKRVRDGDVAEASPPPPPPPPPSGAVNEVDVAEQRALQEQEEALMRENEEAQRLEDEALKAKELEDAAQQMQREMAATT